MGKHMTFPILTPTELIHPLGHVPPRLPHASPVPCSNSLLLLRSQDQEDESLHYVKKIR